MANKVFQVANLNSLLIGNYDPMYMLRDLEGKYDFGIGTFEGLDGEMILIDGKFYQLKADGIAYQPDKDGATPFCTLSNFKPTQKEEINTKFTFSDLCQHISSIMPERNCPVLVRFDGEFNMVHFRSVPKQSKPYKPLAVVAKTQPEFTHERVKGTLIGVRFPKYMGQLNMPGYHLHFIDEGRGFGGHVLGFEISNGTLSLAESHGYEVYLPEHPSFAASDLSADRHEEAKAVEGGN